MEDMEYFRDKIAVVTGGAQGIGRCIAEEFLKAGAQVCVIDKAAIKREPTSSLDWPSGSRLGEAKQDGDHFVGDIADKQTLEQFAQEVIAKHGHVDYLINNALPLMKGINACSYEEFQYAIRVRVNSISPGWIDTAYTVYEGPDAIQQPVGRVGNPLDIANMVLYLCSDKAGFITGENICIDGGMTHQMIYHADNGWKLESQNQ
jgi:NAD(P)-dependent dehydrogenase (short-subunit alcohol dehydrogenase family)